MAKKKKARGGAAIQTVKEPTLAAQPAAEETKPRGPRKTCPKCHADVGAATRTCPECGYKFVKKAGAKTPVARTGGRKPVAEKAGPTGDVVSAVRSATEFAGQVGGIDQAISLLEALKQVKG